MLESCLAVFRAEEDLTGQAMALSALAHVWNERGELAQAVSLARQALAIRNRLPSPSGRAISHTNLSNYLTKAGHDEAAAQHHCAAIVYGVVTGGTQVLQTDLQILAIDLRSAAQPGQRYDLPLLRALLALPEFAALQQFLVSREEDLDQLQAQLDELVAQVRRQAEAS